MDEFLQQHALRELSPNEKSLVLKLLEMQRHAMLMYTSCGWFFDELSGLETVQVLQYAGRVVQLARDVLGDDHEARFLERLEQAKSNIPEHGDGRRIFEKFVKPAMVDLLTVGAHYAISSLFEDYQVQDRIFCYTVDREDYRLAEAGKAKLAVGRIQVTSDITWNAATVSFAVLHFGDHNLVRRRAGVPGGGGLRRHGLRRSARPFPGRISPRPSAASINTSETPLTPCGPSSGTNSAKSWTRLWK